MRFVTPLRAAIVAFLIAATAVGGLVVRSGPETYEVTAAFPRAIGLYEGSTVRVLGVEVGRIREVRPDGDRIRVRMAIRDGVRIPADARAIIVPISLISDRYVQLSPVWEGGPALSDGDSIPLDRGVAPAELGELLKTLEELLVAIEPGSPDSPGALGQVVVNADEALSGRGQELGTTIDGLSTILDVLGRNADHFDSILVDVDRLVGELARRDAQVRATNRGLASVLGALAEERDALESGVGNLALLVDQAGGLIREHQADLTRDLQILSDTTDMLVRQRDFLERNVRWLPVLAQGALNAFDEENRRVLVRDNQNIREGGAASTTDFEPPPLGPGPGVDGQWLLWPGGTR